MLRLRVLGKHRCRCTDGKPAQYCIVLRSVFAGGTGRRADDMIYRLFANDEDIPSPAKHLVDIAAGDVSLPLGVTVLAVEQVQVPAEGGPVAVLREVMHRHGIQPADGTQFCLWPARKVTLTVSACPPNCCPACFIWPCMLLIGSEDLAANCLNDKSAVLKTVLRPLLHQSFKAWPQRRGLLGQQSLAKSCTCPLESRSASCAGRAS